MRIGMVTQWYDPEGGSAMTFGVIARALHALGHDVDVLTGFPNYPSGQLAEGYRMKPYQKEVLQGITVHRAPLYVSHDANPIHRAANYLSFGSSAGLLAARALGKSDAVLVVPSPPFVASAGLALKYFKRIPFVLHVQDLWPESVTASGMISGGTVVKAEKVLHEMMDRLYSEASHIAVTSPGMADAIASRGVSAEKLSFVSNWADERLFHPSSNPAVFEGVPDWSFKVMYAGAMGDVQGLEVMLEAADLLRAHEDIGFLMVGSGVARASLEAEATRRDLKNIAFVPPQPAQRMAEVLAAADVQVISLRDLPVFASTLPSKLPATLAAARPIIGAVGGDAARVIGESGSGWVTAPGSGKELADAVLEARAMQPDELAARGKSGQDYYRRRLSQEVGAARLVELLEQAAAINGAKRKAAGNTSGKKSSELSQSESERVERVYSARGYDTDLEYADVNPVYLQRVQSMESATLSAIREAGFWDRLANIDILDYGCGNGRWFGRWLAWGASPDRLHGVDIRMSAVEIARSSFPQCHIKQLENGRIPYPESSFDVVISNLVFSSMIDEEVRRSAADELMRVLKPGGVLLSCDFAVDNPANPDVRAFKRGDAERLFAGLQFEREQKLILAPPLARRMVPRSWGAADLAERMLPMLRTHRLLTFRKSQP